MLITSPAPLRVRLTLLAYALWARAKATGAGVVASPAARPTLSTLLELLAVVALVHALFLIAPWLGWLAIAAGLGGGGWLLEPRRTSSPAAAE